MIFRVSILVVIVFDQEYPENVILLIAREIVAEFYKVYDEKQLESVKSNFEFESGH